MAKKAIKMFSFKEINMCIKNVCLFLAQKGNSKNDSVYLTKFGLF